MLLTVLAGAKELELAKRIFPITLIYRRFLEEEDKVTVDQVTSRVVRVPLLGRTTAI